MVSTSRWSMLLVQRLVVLAAKLGCNFRRRRHAGWDDEWWCWYKTYIISAQRPALAGPRRWIIKLIIYTAGTPPSSDRLIVHVVVHVVSTWITSEINFKPMTDEWYPTDVFKPWQNRITIVCLGGYTNGSYVVHTCAYNNSLLWLCGGMWYPQNLSNINVKRVNHNMNSFISSYANITPAMHVYGLFVYSCSCSLYIWITKEHQYTPTSTSRLHHIITYQYLVCITFLFVWHSTLFYWEFEAFTSS